MVEPVYFVHFLSIIKVCNAVRCYLESGVANCQDDWQTHHIFLYSIEIVLMMPEHLHLTETDLYWPQNITSIGMVKADRQQ